MVFANPLGEVLDGVAPDECVLQGLVQFATEVLNGTLLPGQDDWLVEVRRGYLGLGVDA